MMVILSTMQVNNLTEIEQSLTGQGFKRIMGLDEVGRGCLAGPVVAAGVILDPGNIPAGINDSKKLNRTQRESLAEQIKNSALFYAIRFCDVGEIGRLNILWASLQAMQKCVDSPQADPDFLLIDGNRYLPSLIPHSCLVKGDSRSASIAAASIIAKVWRDEHMRELSLEYPEYNWAENVGYPTTDHFEALERFGITPHHRPGFKLRTTKLYQEKGPISR